MGSRVDVKLKVCLLGDGAVGKTSLIRRYVKDSFNDSYILTLGTKTSKKEVVINKPELQKVFHITFMIWDIMGQYSFRKLLHPTYLKGAKGAILVCDLTRRETLEHLDDWIDSLFVEGQVMPFIVVANKMDLRKQRDYELSDVEKVATDYMAPLLTASAKTGENVEHAFKKLGEMIVDGWIRDNNPIIHGIAPRPLRIPTPPNY